MKSPFLTLAKVTRMSRKGRPWSAALMLHRAILTSSPLAKPDQGKGKSRAGQARGVSARSQRPKPGSFIEGQFDCREGSLRYRLYTPVGSARRKLPLIVMLHGCTQRAADFAAATRMNRLADEMGFLVLYPEQSAGANPNRCWNWHRPTNQTRGSGEAAVIAGMTRYVANLCKAHPDKLYVAGLSAGGSAAAIIAGAYPRLYVAVGVHSAVPLGKITTLSEALAAMRGKAAPPMEGGPTPPPMILFHGDQDRVVDPANAAGFVSQLQRSIPRLTLVSKQGRSPGGRSFTRTLYHRATGPILLEEWTIHGSGHAWSGGSPLASHTDPAGPDASRAMAVFFLARRRRTK